MMCGTTHVDACAFVIVDKLLVFLMPTYIHTHTYTHARIHTYTHTHIHYIQIHHIAYNLSLQYIALHTYVRSWIDVYV